MAELADFLPDVQPLCEGVPIPIAERAILHACREFCTVSGYWRADQLFDTVTDETGDGEYTLTLAAGTELATVKTPIYHDGREVYLKSPEDLSAQLSSDWRTLTGERAKFFTMTSKVIIRLVPYPLVAVVNDLRVTKILRPSLTSPTVDDTVLADWSEQIAFGAVARIKATPDKDYSDPTGVDFYQAKFDEACANAKSRAIAMWQDRRHQRQRKTAARFF